ncbi:MAG: hypothetical protein HY005_02120 [Candidatus Staskawiczbacteria bacterium]|nr:hypothetical protein [Candidatus Staskawiczbacteria bacterium]
MLNKKSTRFILLNLIGKSFIPGSKRFVLDKVSLKEVNVGWTSNNFNELFLGKIEENIKDTTLAIHCLEKRSLDNKIRKELGYGDETTLTHFLGLIKKQSNGQEGHLTVSGYANIAYIRDKYGSLWVVSAYWHLDKRCWYILANSVDNPYEWHEGLRVISIQTIDKIS